MGFIMLLSVIVPHFNSAIKLKRLVDSIAISEESEVVIVDDYSNEENKNILQDLGIDYIENNGDKGAGSCRNIGLSMAKGKYIIFADADDYFVNNGIQKILEDIHSSVIDVIYYSPTSIIEGTNQPSFRHKPYSKLVENYINRSDISIRYKFHVPWSKVIRREFIVENDIKFDEVMVSNDVMFSLQVGHKAENIIAKKDVIYCVTDGDGSLTKNSSKKNLICRFDVACRYNNYLIINNLREYSHDPFKCIVYFRKIMSLNTLVKLYKSYRV